MCLYNVEHNFQESRKGASNAELITLIESNNIKRTISVERGAKNDIHKKIYCNFALRLRWRLQLFHRQLSHQME